MSSYSSPVAKVYVFTKHLTRFYEKYNAFQCNISSSKHAGLWENTSSSVGNQEAQPSGFPALFEFQRPKRLDEAIFHGNKFYIPLIKKPGAVKNGDLFAKPDFWRNQVRCLVNFSLSMWDEPSK